MNKQNQIRGEIEKIIKSNCLGVLDGELKGASGNILSYLHERSVVIKVECPDCAWSQFGDGSVGMTPCYSCNSTGYITEPLIKEG